MTPGTRLGPYEIVAMIGAGGMGEVYRGRDTRLRRDVAIKVLPESFASDPDRVTRFQREAEALASLNHPNIASIHDLSEIDGTRFLVLELVEGDSLAARLTHGPLPVDEALDVGRQVAEALEAAHGKDILHRDLKPANIQLTPDGHVKVLDFGLAKMMDPADSGIEISHSPTISIGATGRGVILGTAAYMSPEQARGRTVDRRTDVWALGCVLFETLTAKKAFPGDDVTDVIASVVKSEPEWNALPAATPPAVRALLKSCLQKDLRRRCQHVGDARIAIEDAIARPEAPTPSAGVTAPQARPLWRRALPVVVTAIVVGVVATVVTWNLRQPGPTPIVRFPIVLPEGRQIVGLEDMLAVSPDGTRLAYASSGKLFLHNLAESEAKALAEQGTAVSSPVFSPDGQWIAFWSQDSTLRRVAVTGGAAEIICKTDRVLGVTWQGDDIVFAATGGAGILRVSSRGGEPQTILRTNPGEVVDSPQILDGDKVLFTVATGRAADRWDTAQVVVQSLSGGERKVVVQGGSKARYLPTGHLVYAVGARLFAAPFDLDRLEMRGQPVQLIDGIMRSSNPASSGAVAQVAWSATGTLAYVRGLGFSRPQRIALVDRLGTIRALPLPSRPWIHPRVSPDGKRLVVGTDDGKEAAVWTYTLGSADEPRRLTFEGRNTSPIWGPGSTQVTFQSDRQGELSLFRQPADGGKPAELVAKPDAGFSLRPEAWSPDGKTLAFLKFPTNGSGDILALSNASPQPVPLAMIPESNERYATFSPDGRWFAYVSTELSGASTNFQVFVQPFPPTGAKHLVTPDSGREPLWSPDGKQLFYVVRPTDELVAVDIRTEPSFDVGKAVVIPKVRLQAGGPGRSYDITPDGKQFVVAMPASAFEGDRKPQEQIDVVLNWFEELRQRVPVR